ncbi:nuclear transport factor 2 family protein, partial [Streptomyces sp. CHA16]|uniref:nuclear transport factor 2 family protein n=1 Tax=Streptomyces sp. CHA16 TaxID=2841667 RepID=UPI0020956131
ARERVLRAHLDAVSRGDDDAVIGTYRHPRMELVGTGRVIDGADAVRQHLQERRRAFPDQSFELICHHHSDRAVIAELWMS